MLVIREA